ncbi:unnamed protein product [Amoebophrya sp. A120]|nr:unnamed protein product [Amoebophrya sp. A120]|eukprot:GSA120T00017919001.1
MEGIDKLLDCAVEHVGFLLASQTPAGFENLGQEIEHLAQSSHATEPQEREKAFRLWNRLRRLAQFSPQLEVREKCSQWCALLHPPTASSHSGSSFDQSGEAEKPPVDFGSPSWQDLFQQKNGNLTTLHWALAAHDGFLDRFFSSKRALLFDEGPLPKPWRHYLALLGATQLRCEYLARHAAEMFLLVGGDRTWLAGRADVIPKKLLAIAKFNEVMCHQPWLLLEQTGEGTTTSPSHGNSPEKHDRSRGTAVVSFAELLDPDDSACRWSSTELLSALAILSTYHSMSAFVFALGLELEDPLAPGDEKWILTDGSTDGKISPESVSLIAPAPQAQPEPPDDTGVAEEDENNTSKNKTVMVASNKESYRTASFATARSEEEDLTSLERQSTSSGGDKEKHRLVVLEDPKRAQVLAHLPCCFRKNLSESANWYYFISKQEEQELLNPIKSEKDWRELGRLTDNALTQEERHSLQEVMAARPIVRAPLCDFLLARASGVELTGLEDASDVGTKGAETFKLKYVDYGAGAASAASQYSWADHAYPLLGQYCPEIADAIHEEYEYVQSYTDSSVGGIKVSSTLPIRRALFAYVFRVYGLEVDDFNYTRLNFYLTLMHKVFLKKLCCFPEALTREDYDRVKAIGGYNLRDMIQYIHIATQVRRVMQLQYVMAAFQRYQTRRESGNT